MQKLNKTFKIDKTVELLKNTIKCHVCVGHGLLSDLSVMKIDGVRKNTTVCIKKKRTAKIIWHNYTNSQRSLIIFGRDRPHSILNLLC